MQKPALEIHNASVELGGQLILKDVNFQVDHGETLVVLGPSGEGKTVLIKTMAGIYPPKTGHVYVEGEDWQKLESEEKHELSRKVGMLFQKSALFDSMSALDNVSFPFREHTQLNDEEIKSLATQLLDSVGLKDAVDKLPHELSGGMQKRLAIARALALHPEIIFYDDPIAGQDPINSDKIIQLILKFKRENNSTLIVVTNDIIRAFEMADRILLVANQEVLDVGTVDDVRNSKDERVQQFIHGKLDGPLRVKI